MSRRILSILTFLFVLCALPFQGIADIAENGVADVGQQSSPMPGAMVFTGAASYSVPISVLPGRNGLAPNLSLSYNSFSGNGWVGLGWNLGLPSISRNTKRGLDYSANDFIAGSGELIPWPDWGTGYYRAKIEKSFSKYYYDTANNTWIVTAKSGTRFFYGASANSRVGKDEVNTFTWMLERVEDTNGNYFIASYTQDQGQSYLSTIEYTGHDYNNGIPGLAPSNRVEFELEDRPDPLEFHTIGKKIVIAKRLKAIKLFTKVNGQDALNMMYALEYETDAPINLSRLKKVQKIGSDGISAMPPVELTWNNGGLVNYGSYQATSTPGSSAPGYIRFADLNGDGKDDIIRHDSDGIVYTALGRGDGAFESFNTITGPGGQGAGYVSLADVNADGKVDLIKHDANGVVYYAFSTGDGLFGNFTAHSGPGGSGEWQVSIVDLNGDGAGDLIKSTKNKIDTPTGPQPVNYVVQVETEPVNETTYIYLFDKTTNTYSDTYTQIDGLHGGMGKEFLIDINHDYYPDLIRMDDKNHALYIFRNNKQGEFETTPTTYTAPEIARGYIKFSDVNADGAVDLIAWNSNEDTFVYLNNGNSSFLNTPVIHSAPGGKGANLVQIRDVNNDGYSDLIKEDTSKNVYVYLAKAGNGEFKTTGYYQSSPSSDTRLGVMFIDINGDGVLDLVRKTENNAIYSYSAAGFGTPSLLKSARIENAASISMEYTPSTQFNHTLMPNKTFLVTSKTIDDGLGNLSTETYEYADGLYDFEDREFRGFGYVKKTNPDGSVSKTWFHQDKYFKGMVYESQFLEPDEAKILTRSTSLYETVELDNSDDPVVFIKTTQTRSEAYDGETTFIQKNIEYDDNVGNPIRVIMSGTGSESSVSDIVYENVGAGTNDWIWRKTQETLSGEEALTDPGAGKVREQYFVYDPTTGNLDSESSWLEGDTNPSVSYDYDIYGNRTSLTNARGYTSTVTYDEETQTFVIRGAAPSTIAPDSTTIIEHNVSTTYNYLYAQPATVTDGNGRTTSYIYDAFGRNIQTDFPDGGQSVTEFYDFTIPRYTVSKVKENANDGLVIVGYNFSDGLGRPIQSVTNGENQYIVGRKYYDNMGRAYMSKGPFFSNDASWPQEPSENCPWAKTQYDYLGRPTIMETPGDNGPESDTTLSFLIYNGLKITIIDPDGSKKEEIKDYRGLAKEVIQYSNTETIHTQYSYNVAKDLLKTTNTYGKETILTYDTLGRKKTMQDPDMGNCSYEYDIAGNMLSQTDAKGQTTQFTYDKLDRPLKKEILNPGPKGDEPVIYQYDNPNIPNGIGRIYTVTKANTQTIYDTYDIMGRAKVITKVINGISYTTSKEYDLSGKVIKLTYPDDFYVEYTYISGTGLLYNTIGSDTTTQAWFSEYEPTGNIGAIDYGNGAFTTYIYDEQTTRLTSMNTWDSESNYLQYKQYTYSKAGDITTIVDNTNNITHEYTYDRLHRLTAETTSNESIPVSDVSVMDYKYEQNESDPYHAVSNITHNNEYAQYAYDANGNMTASPDIKDSNHITRSITYNSDDMPMQITKGDTTVDFTYDGHGSRVQKVVNNTFTTTYIGSHYEIRNNTPTKYIFAGNVRVAMIKSNSPTYFHKDHLGSSTVLTDTNGLILNNNKAVYNPYGSIKGDNDITETPYKFTDQEFDDETGLYNYNARLYDPVVGKFISADSIIPDPLDSQSFNRYSYCNNNPIMYVDPSGHFSFNWKKMLFGGPEIGIIHNQIDAAIDSLPNETAKNIMVGINNGLQGSVSPLNSIEDGGAIGGMAWLTGGTLSYSYDEGWGVHASGNYYCFYAGASWQEKGYNAGFSISGGVGYSYGYFTVGFGASYNFSRGGGPSYSISAGGQYKGNSAGISYNLNNGSFSGYGHGSTNFSLADIGPLAEILNRNVTDYYSGPNHLDIEKLVKLGSLGTLEKFTTKPKISDRIFAATVKASLKKVGVILPNPKILAFGGPVVAGACTAIGMVFSADPLADGTLEGNNIFYNFDDYYNY